MMRDDTLERYRNVIMSVVHGNHNTLLTEDRMSAKQKAGTALLMATASAAFAAGLMAKTDPRLKNAPFEAQLDDMLDLLREVLIEKHPQISLVETPVEGGEFWSPERE